MIAGWNKNRKKINSMNCHSIHGWNQTYILRCTKEEGGTKVIVVL